MNDNQPDGSDHPDEPAGAAAESSPAASGPPAGGRPLDRPDPAREPLRATRATQGRLVLDSIDGVAAWPPDSHEEGRVEFFYRPDTLLVRDWNAAAVVRALGDVGVQVEPVDLPGSLTRLRITDRRDDLGSELRAPHLVRWLDAGRSTVQGLRPRDPLRGFAAPEHLLYTCDVHSCAATEPDVVPAGALPSPRLDEGAAGASPAGSGGGVRVVIVDTGLVEGAAGEHAWLAGVTGERDTVLGADGLLMQDAGHGTFAAGCVRAVAPRASVDVLDATSRLTPKDAQSATVGAVYEGDLAVAVHDALVAPGGALTVPDVLLINFAGPTLDDRPPVGLMALYDDLIKHLRELLVVAPAGNEGDTTRNWPAAFPWVVGVGALGADWRTRADFSNHGPTTDVFAPGTDIVNAYASGRYTYRWAGPRHGSTLTFKGMARWSGTSFAAPLVAGLVAARMSQTGQSSHRAWLSLLDLAESQAVPGTGPVLYPGQGSTR